MKRLKLLLVIVALSCATSASAVGLSWSVIAGISNADFSVKGDGDYLSDSSGYCFGLSLKAKLPIMDFGPEIIYSYNKMSVTSTGYFGQTGTIRANSIDVPVVASLNILGPLKIEVGPTFSLYSNAEAEYGNNTEDIGRFKSDVGYLLGAKVTIMGKLMVGARIYGQFEPHSVHLQGVSRDISYWGYALSVGAKF